MAPETLESIFVRAMIDRLPAGAGGAVDRAADSYVRRGVLMNARGRALQFYPLADRAWTRWVSSSIRATGFPDLADVVSRQGVMDQPSAALAANLAPEYRAQLARSPGPSLPGAPQLRENATVALECSERLLTIVAEEPPGLGEVDPAAFNEGVRSAARALIAVWHMGIVDLPGETRAVMAGASGGAVKLAY